MPGRTSTRRALHPRLVRVLLCALVLVPFGMLVAISYSLSITLPEMILDPSAAGGTGSVGLSTLGAVFGAVVGLVFGSTAAFVTASTLGLAIRLRWPDPVPVAVVVVVVFVLSYLILGATGSWEPDPGRVVFSAVAALGAGGASALALIPRMSRP